jgi:tetratricopeptide (TPR) repeat protein
MSPPPRQHYWVTGPSRAARWQATRRLGLPPGLATVDAHRRLRGPYTAAGTLLRQLVPAVLAAQPALVAAHDVEILTAAPELRATVPASRETLTSLAVPAERTRFYSRLRTLRIAHGLVEFLTAAAGVGAGPRTLVLENLDAADPTDQEFVAVLLRRMEPARLTVVVGTTGTELPEPLGLALRRHATAVRAAALPPVAPGRRASQPELARRYVWSDGSSDDAVEIGAYQSLPAAVRAALHDARAAELEAAGEFSVCLGAVPYHREHGADPAGAGAAALRTALDYCIDIGFYPATVDFGHRGRAVIDWAGQTEMYWAFTTKLTTSLAALDRSVEAEALYDEARAGSSSPAVHMQAAYATAMLYTRHHGADRKDHDRARAWINAAIAIAAFWPDPVERAFHSVFNQNGLALVEVHRGNLTEALRLVSAGLDRLAAELGPDGHQLHRSVLRHNRAQVHVALGDLDSALADYDAVIVADPNYSEYHLDRGTLLRRLGRPAAALADYEAAIRCSPPYPEAYYNRADTLAELGDTDRALADFSYVLELDPEHADARLNLAGLLLGRGDVEPARAAVALLPPSPHAACLRGQLAGYDGDHVAAEREFTAALAADGQLAAGWAGRAASRYAAGDPAGAVADLDRAVQLADDPAAHFNRGVARQALGDWPGSIVDFTAALELAGDDPDLLYQRGRSHLELGHAEAGQADLTRAAELPAGAHHGALVELLLLRSASAPGAS